MTPAELKSLIESDAEALALARSGAADLCALRCMAIAPKINAETVLTERGLYQRLGATVAETILQKLEGFAATQNSLAAVVRRFLKWLEPVNGGADWGQPEALAMCHALMQGGLLTQEECDAIHALSLVAPTITGADVSTAYPFPPQD